MRTLRLAVMAGSVAAVAIGCGLFDVREPSKPTQIEVDYDLATEPRIALRNLERSTEARTIANYDRAVLADIYRFRPDPFDVTGSDTLWTWNQDQSRLTGLFQNEAEVDLTWTVRDSGSVDDDLFYRNLGYRLVFRFDETDSVVLGGRCTIYFRQVGLEWKIFRWADVRDETAERTWGSAKLTGLGQG